MNIAEIIENSFKNFHTKGLDYLCLKRTPEHTRKVYFFEGDVSKLPEVVNPHDHRYHFTTTILTGVMSNSIYTENEKYGEIYNEFVWRTPLNGGNGFTFKKETRLFEEQRFFYIPGQIYDMKAEDFHTIRMHTDNTVLILDQYEDIVPIEKPTKTFMKDIKSTNLDGLYEKFNEDEIIKRIRQIEGLMS